MIHRRPQLRPSLRIVPGVALAAALGLAPLALTGIPVIARLLISTALFGAAVLVTHAYPPELIELIPGRRARANARVVKAPPAWGGLAPTYEAPPARGAPGASRTPARVEQ